MAPSRLHSCPTSRVTIVPCILLSCPAVPKDPNPSMKLQTPIANAPRLRGPWSLGFEVPRGSAGSNGWSLSPMSQKQLTHAAHRKLASLRVPRSTEHVSASLSNPGRRENWWKKSLPPCERWMWLHRWGILKRIFLQTLFYHPWVAYSPF